MAHVQPRDAAELEHLRPLLDEVREQAGYHPNSLLTMAHLPQLPLAVGLLMRTVRGGDLRDAWERLAGQLPDAGPSPVEQPLLQLAAFATSVAAGCRYCQAHAAQGLAQLDVPEEKATELLRFETSPHFADAERAVVALALASGQTPNGAGPAHFEALRNHFDDRQIVQLVAVISLFAFLTRWNDTLATALEDPPRAHAASLFGIAGWSAGKHGGHG